MFTNLTSFIFGGQASSEDGQIPSAVPQQHPAGAVPNAPVQEELGSGEDDWVLVGNGAVPRTPNLTLGSLNEINPRPSTGSTGSSNSPSEDGEEELEVEEELLEDEDEDEDAASVEINPAAETTTAAPNRVVTLSRSARRLISPFSGNNAQCQLTSLPQLKAARSAQLAKQKRSAKSLSGKATERKNKAIKATPSKCSKRQASQRANLNIKQGGKGIKQC